MFCNNLCTFKIKKKHGELIVFFWSWLDKVGLLSI